MHCVDGKAWRPMRGMNQMRSEQEMLNLILDVAKRDDRIRAVAMNGSRTNPNVPKDMFQDYDIVYLVTGMESFLKDKSWLDVFGERMIMQMPDEMAMSPSAPPCKRFAYLMQCMDGNRIDLTLVPLGQLEAYSREDKLIVVLLDKDNCMLAIPAPTDEDYWVKPPFAKLLADCCNEFWWVSPYVAKGLWRKEILYAKQHLNIVRAMLLRMLELQVGIETGFSVSIGKSGKYLEKYLSRDSWLALLSTYADGSYEATWDSLFAACDLFRQTAMLVAAHFGYDYPEEEDRRVTAYLRRVRELPAGATELY